MQADKRGPTKLDKPTSNTRQPTIHVRQRWSVNSQASKQTSK